MHASTRLIRTYVPLMLSVVALAGCESPPGPPQGVSTAGTTEAYGPGLGELMSLQQMRHTKLWFAGQAENWNLAAYEIDELTEGFDDVVAFHPTHKDAPVAPRDMIPQLVTEPLDSLRTSVARGDSRAFASAYNSLTLACNDCHQAMDFGFNRVQAPTSNPYSNQVFAP